MDKYYNQKNAVNRSRQSLLSEDDDSLVDQPIYSEEEDEDESSVDDTLSCHDDKSQESRATLSGFSKARADDAKAPLCQRYLDPKITVYVNYNFPISLRLSIRLALVLNSFYFSGGICVCPEKRNQSK